MKQQVVPTSDLKGRVDFGIITIREDEFQAILRRLPTEKLAKGRQTYSISTLRTSYDAEYTIAAVRCPEQGNLQGLSVAQKLIEELDPQWLLLVGIAGCIPDNEYTLGDVILANRLYDFCVSATFENSPNQFSTRGGPMHPQVESYLAALQLHEPLFEKWNTARKIFAQRPAVRLNHKHFYGNDEWRKKVREGLTRYFGKKSIRNMPKVFTGSVASSDTLVKDTQLVQEWQQSARQVAGIEMELSGVYQAAHDSQKPVLAIRGISDIVGFKRSPEWTSYACHSAASLTLALLKSQPIDPLSLSSDEQVALSHNANHSNSPRSNNVFTAVPHNVLPLVKAERLYSNLLELAYVPEILNVVRTHCERRSEVWNILRDVVEHPPVDWVYHGQSVYSFDDFADPMWAKVIGGEIPEAHETRHWSMSSQIARTNIAIELFKGCLIELGRSRDLSYRHKIPLRFLYFSPTVNLSPRIVTTRSLKRDGAHTVFKGFTYGGSREIQYYRHHAFRFEFERIDSTWYLQITPTYHYTSNGKYLYRYYEDKISGIKRQENNEAVFRQVLFWAEVLKDDQSNFLQQQGKYIHLQFGELVEFNFGFGVNDDAWLKKETKGGRDASTQKSLQFEVNG